MRSSTSGPYTHTHISERYAKLRGEREYRLEWAERIGLDSKLQAQLDYSEWTRMQPKSLIYFGGRDRGRTGDLIVANDAHLKLRRGVAIT
jgi:hypothetical protein